VNSPFVRLASLMTSAGFAQSADHSGSCAPGPDADQAIDYLLVALRVDWLLILRPGSLQDIPSIPPGLSTL